MNDLCADIGYKSINHVGEQLCGDHVEVVEVDDNSTIIVLSVASLLMSRREATERNSAE